MKSESKLCLACTEILHPAHAIFSFNIDSIIDLNAALARIMSNNDVPITIRIIQYKEYLNIYQNIIKLENQLSKTHFKVIRTKSL